MTYVALEHPEDNVSRVERRAAIERRTVPAEVGGDATSAVLRMLATLRTPLIDSTSLTTQGKIFGPF